MKQHYIMPVGVDDFRRVREEYYYVDKTDFIKNLIDGHSQVTLITRPRRFGKTLSLSMLQYFFTLENAAESRQLFAGLDIERAGEKYMSQQGTRPVVFLTLKELRARAFANMTVLMAEFLRRLYGQYAYLGQSDALSSEDRQYFSDILKSACGMEKMKFALSNLMAALEKHHQKKPVLLLDE